MKKIRLCELGYLYLILAFANILIGYLIIKYFKTINLTTFTFKKINTNENPGVLFFFYKNLFFFFIMSLTPYINLIISSLQMLQIGVMFFQISSLSFDTRFVILYRHLIFEFIALFLAIVVSLNIYSIITSILNDLPIDKRKTILRLGIYYILIVVFTLIGALLEGGAYA